MKSGIYALVNRENGKRYIGRTIDFAKRETTHFWMLKNNRHPNCHLQRAWNAGQRFDFTIIEECPPEKCNEREVYWIDKLDTMANGYNQCEGGQTTMGYRFTPEQKKKISEAQKGKRRDPRSVEKGKATLKRRLESDPQFAAEYRKRLSERTKGRPSWNKGRPCPEWKKKHLSEALKGREVTKEHRERLREMYSGEGSTSAKLKKTDVVEIRYRYLSGERQIDIAKDYPVTPQTIYDIVRGRRWASVPNTLEELEAMR